MRVIFSVVVVSLLLISCSQSKERDNFPIVKVGNEVLTKEVLDENIPAGLSSNDSIIQAEHYIRTWINEVLMYDMAKKNTSDIGRINQLVENYRKSLIIYQYQEQLINEKLVKKISEQDLYDYYRDNKEKFKVDKYLAQGVISKVIDSLSTNDIIPFEYVKPIVQEMLVNQRKIDFQKQTENDIYQRALNRGDVKFYKE
jgi:hypothetical protein